LIDRAGPGENEKKKLPASDIHWKRRRQRRETCYTSTGWMPRGIERGQCQKKFRLTDHFEKRKIRSIQKEMNLREYLKQNHLVLSRSQEKNSSYRRREGRETSRETRTALTIYSLAGSVETPGRLRNHSFQSFGG